MASFKTMTEHKALKVGTYLGEFATSGVGQILKSAGCEFVFLDMEHSGFSFETAKAVLRTLHDAGIATVLRPPSQANHHIARACDVGAQGICPPMMSTAQQAQSCIDAINYPPLGKRGAAFAIAHDDYQPRSVVDAISFANAKTSFVALLETAEGVENCEQIAALDGCDCVWIGHFDLSNSLGIPGEFDNPHFIDAVARIMAAAKANGKSVGRLVGSPEEAKRLNEEGCDFICYSGDIW
ncbi:MAG: HpcH/HpaI aldolase family protein, partial [Hyphomicrobiaceae bacterium]